MGWNSYKQYDPNVNGDRAMNTDTVQTQFKRSHQSVNIHTILGITTRDLSRTGDFEKEIWQEGGNALLGIVLAQGLSTRPLTETSGWLVSGFNFVPSGSAPGQEITGGEQMGR